MFGENDILFQKSENSSKSEPIPKTNDTKVLVKDIESLPIFPTSVPKPTPVKIPPVIRHKTTSTQPVVQIVTYGSSILMNDRFLPQTIENLLQNYLIIILSDNGEATKLSDFNSVYMII